MEQMLLDGVWRLIEERAFTAESTEMLFNPWMDEVPELDRASAAAIRRDNLRSYLESFKELPALLLVGEAPGPWGCRFSGVPFTGEAQLCGGELPFAGRQSSAGEKPYREMSGTIVWQTLRSYYPGFFMWNCVPLHPHQPGRPLSIRTPTPSEVAAYGELLGEMCALLSPRLVVAIGRVAERSLSQVGISARYVRHPSQGGAKEFKAGMEAILRRLPA